MTNRVTVIYQDGQIMTSPCNTLPLARMQELVGGYIEVVPYFTKYEGERCVALCDEEGKLKDKPVNVEATKIWYDQLATPPIGHDVLVGAVVIIQGADLLRRL